MSEQNRPYISAFIFIAIVFAVSLFVKLAWIWDINIPYSTMPIFVGAVGFLFWILVYRKPVVEIYSKGYPYRKLKIWGIILSVLLFEYILIWGLHTQKIRLIDEHFYSIIIILIGTIVFYFGFVRMRVSLRYLFLGIFIPIFAAGSAIGLGKYFNALVFSVPAQNIFGAVFLNTFYWILFYILFTLICEEPVFRGVIIQSLVDKNKLMAIIISSIAFAAWNILIRDLRDVNLLIILYVFLEYLIIGVLLALLFLRGKNLLVTAIANGIIKGLKTSFLSNSVNSGLGDYFQPANKDAAIQLLMIWLACLLVSVVFVLLTPEKKRNIILPDLNMRVNKNGA